MVLHPAAGLGDEDLIHIVEVDPACKQEHDQQNARNLFIVLIKDIGNRLDLVLRDSLLQSGRDGHNEKGQAADPDHCRQKMKPVIDDRDKGIEIGDDTLKGVHFLDN